MGSFGTCCSVPCLVAHRTVRVCASPCIMLFVPAPRRASYCSCLCLAVHRSVRICTWSCVVQFVFVHCHVGCSFAGVLSRLCLALHYAVRIFAMRLGMVAFIRVFDPAQVKPVLQLKLNHAPHTWHRTWIASHSQNRCQTRPQTLCGHAFREKKVSSRPRG